MRLIEEKQYNIMNLGGYVRSRVGNVIIATRWAAGHFKPWFGMTIGSDIKNVSIRLLSGVAAVVVLPVLILAIPFRLIPAVYFLKKGGK